ncbi:glycoside hydrolase family 2 protein [Teratosphaeria destructans]|uniref:Glycoside hydrolase family 2 protein n=1 Tax=Teratosphaeria destructans TaxID=418781 RepID=A0A9W7VY84_9PEZI|nr:glycoside hydrolase family 2 protein [Teratosphaeria destructans]
MIDTDSSLFPFAKPHSLLDSSAYLFTFRFCQLTDGQTLSCPVRYLAVDYQAIVWLEGQYIGSHRGGHVPFDLDLTDAIRAIGQKEGYRIVVRVFDSAHDVTQPRGKQYWGPEPESTFYTPSSGIWQNVWIEAVPQMRLANSSHGTFIRSNDVEKGVIDARIAVQGRRLGQKCAIGIEASFYGITVSKSERIDLPRDEDFVRFDHSMRLNQDQLRRLPAELLHDAPLSDAFCWRNGVALWSPEHPALYDLTIRLYDSGTSTLIDEIKTTTGMRSLNWYTGDGTFRLNGKPYFQALFLDQGHWPESLMTPPCPSALKQDIVLSKQMGFNGCRKHQKVEDPIFYYYADRLEFLVWGEMASTYNFSLESVSRFDSEWLDSVRLGINHPSIITWTPANESWVGRSTITAGGSMRSRSRKGNWGNATASDGADLLKRFENMLTAVCGRGEVCAFVWTQFSDVEQEMIRDREAGHCRFSLRLLTEPLQNGLYSYDRRPKVPAPEVAKGVLKAREAYFAKLYRHC